MLDWWQTYDTWIVVTGALAAMSCALPGTYLVLRRMSMMGDAISHAVLPGIVIAFLMTKSLDSLPMFLGAIVIGILTALLTQMIRRFGGLDEGASMGVVFTSLFAVGLILIRVAADHVDLDPSCVLYGAIELVPLDVVTAGEGNLEIPRAVLYNGGMLLVNLLFVGLLWKELKISAFDPDLATSQGFSADMMHYALMALVAATTVTAFHAVGSILVIAMLIVPPAAAYLLTDRLGRMVGLSLVIAGSSSFLGHWWAVEGPSWFGFERMETSTSGMIAVATGFLFLTAWMFSPRHGLISRWISSFSLSLRIMRDDVLGTLYRITETGSTASRPVSRAQLRETLPGGPVFGTALWQLRVGGRIDCRDGGFVLTPRGEKSARKLIRSHRLWEGWMVEKMGLRPDHVHSTAERLEHITTLEMRTELERQAGEPEHDPHDRQIPREDE